MGKKAGLRCAEKAAAALTVYQHDPASAPVRATGNK